MSALSPWRGYPRQLPGGHLSGSQPLNPSSSWRWQELTRLMDTGDWGHYPETEGEVTLTWICPSFNNNSRALSIDIGTKGLFWPSDDISSSSLCCMGSGLLGVFGARQGRSARFDYFWSGVRERLVWTNQKPSPVSVANGMRGQTGGRLIISLIQYLTLTAHRPSRAQHNLDLNCLQNFKSWNKELENQTICTSSWWGQATDSSLSLRLNWEILRNSWKWK